MIERRPFSALAGDDRGWLKAKQAFRMPWAKKRNKYEVSC
jgi:hypothetical protein